VEVLDILADAGADPCTPDIHGAFPIHYAAQMCGPNSDLGNDTRLGLTGERPQDQGCQMVCFQTKNSNLGKFSRALDWKKYLMDIWNILGTFGIFYDH
jgi:hypothetical protein